MRTNKNTAWSKGLPDVQFRKNRSLHKGIGRSPYEAVFGCKPRIGITTSQLPPEVLDKIETEEQLEAALKQLGSTGDSDSPCNSAAGCNDEEAEESDKDERPDITVSLQHAASLSLKS